MEENLCQTELILCYHNLIPKYNVSNSFIIFFKSRYNLELNPREEIGFKLYPNNYTKTLPIGNGGS
jgi:hypothetical protein